ncbi:T9SS type A sorting domain-containing protein [Flavobacterium sp.]|uniref:T9SS type A sorting domain-containing protein n=1 Tax=Flavobacterium sp. TaxID=239 RepID=UPI0037510411
MNKILLFLMLRFCLIGNAQTIVFSDVNFKNKLLASNTSNGIAKNSFGNGIVVDTNADNEIQVSEALNVSELYLWSPFLNTTNDIVNLNGIQNFLNLKNLNCFGNSITSLNLQGLLNLEYINAGENNISNCNITGLVALKELSIYNNLLTNINIDNLTNLTTISIHDNQLNSLTFNNNSSLENLWCSNNMIPSLNFSNTPSIKNCVCDSNLLTSINLGTVNQINELSCANNMLTSLNISNLSLMTYLDFSSNQIPVINFPSTNIIFQLIVSNNPISTLNLDNLSSLNHLTVSNTWITNLDCSLSTVQQLTCRYNANLQTINVKNNVYTYSDPDLLYFGFVIENNPHLQSICLDNGEQNNLSYNNFSFNATGNVVVYTGASCSTVIPQNTFSNADFASSHLILFPNPTQNNLTIINPDTIQLKSISIHNTIGQLVKKFNNFQENIDVSDLKSGTYFITIELEKGTITEKFIKR